MVAITTAVLALPFARIVVDGFSHLRDTSAAHRRSARAFRFNPPKPLNRARNANPGLCRSQSPTTACDGRSDALAEPVNWEDKRSAPERQRAKR
jgi:hypothetical protein